MKNQKNVKRILSVTVRTMSDQPDTSWLGEYSDNQETEFAIDRKHSLDCQSLEANHGQAVDQLERVIAYLETVRQAGEPPENIYWSAADESQDTLVELQDELQECDCSGGDMGRNEFRYFNGSVENYKGSTPEDIRKYILQDYKRMESLNQGNWAFVGIRVEAEVQLTSDVVQKISSGGLFGIESDSKEHIAEVEGEELSAVKDELLAIGFSTRTISKAFKTLARKDA